MDQIDAEMARVYVAKNTCDSWKSEFRAYESDGQRIIVEVQDDGTFTVYSFHASGRTGADHAA